MKDAATIHRELCARVRELRASPPFGALAKDHPEVYLLPLGFTEEGTVLGRLVAWALGQYRTRRELAEKRQRRPLHHYAAMLAETIRNPNPRYLEEGEESLPYELAGIDVSPWSVRAAKRLLSRRERERAE
jgi:hypothetical protein